jgi:arylsulfatase A
MPKTNYARRNFLKTFCLGTTSLSLFNSLNLGCTSQENSKDSRQPNFIIIFCDDMGYGDLGCFGSTKNRTPNIDQMAQQGMRFTSFYSTCGVCTPSRSSLMTGCYPRRVNMHEDAYGDWVLFPVSPKGLNPSELTIAEVLKKQGYNTACIGKWHLGDQPEFLPTRQGFDYYFGIPYSNDMGAEQRSKNPPLPLMRNEKVIEAPVEQKTLTQRYTQEAIQFITSNQDKPFFLYLPHTMPHLPLAASEQFAGKSANGLYGDTIEEIDWSTGQILNTLKNLNLDENTLVVFTSDNGGYYPGSNLPLSGGKATTMEGGMRIPCIMRWPGSIPDNQKCAEVASTIDLLPTFAQLSDAELPADRIIDGKNIWPLMTAETGTQTPHKAFYYYFMGQLHAVRSGKWKLHLPLKVKHTGWRRDPFEYPGELFDLETDIAEKVNVIDDHPDVVQSLTALAEKAREDIGDWQKPGKGQRVAGVIDQEKPLILLRSK